MKRFTSGLMALAVLSLIAGCEKGPPTLVPTMEFPPTRTSIPTEPPVPTATPIPGPTLVPTVTSVPMATVRRTATLRAGPGVEYGVSGRANFGDTLVVYARCEGWLMVSPDDTQWIIEGRVTLNVDLDAIQDICSAPPEPTPTGD